MCRVSSGERGLGLLLAVETAVQFFRKALRLGLVGNSGLWWLDSWSGGTNHGPVGFLRKFEALGRAQVEFLIWKLQARGDFIEHRYKGDPLGVEVGYRGHSAQ